MAAITIRSDFGTPKNKVWHHFHCFPKQGYHLTIQHSIVHLSQSNLGKRKKSKNIQNLKEEKLALFLGDIVLYTDNLKDLAKNY